jgi:hypothetical protein
MVKKKIRQETHLPRYKITCEHSTALNINNYVFDKKKGKKFFLFIEHEVLFYETPFLHRATRIYVCGATALARADHRPGRKIEKEREKPAEPGSEQT